ncbi:endonuclease/exonuclease/phosphatase family protein [Devosia lucknowensis]|nr:endonuclease/exonuclease/phosphatase family protein [Devosia lucknowensis]
MNLPKGWSRIQDLRPSVLIVSECRTADFRSLPASQMVWLGKGDRGVAIIAPAGVVLTPGPEVQSSIFVTGSFEIFDRHFQIVGVCSKKDPSYTRGTLSAIEQLSGWSRQHFTVWAGDFNQSQKFKRPAGHNFEDAKLAFDSIGLESSYHAITKEPFGAEQSPTYFQYWREERGFHIDYAFGPKGASRKVTVGGYEEWTATSISDHVPIVVDFATG